MFSVFGAARRVLSVGIGGGGDVVGALGVAHAARESGLEARVGGVTWERRVVDPLPGPRLVAEIDGGEPVHPAAILAGPETRGPGGFLFAESNMARVLGEPVALVDPNVGPRVAAEGLDALAALLECDLVALVDVGGDVLGTGAEPGLASPLCDAVLLAAAAWMRTPSIGAVFGAGCDGELTPAEVLGRIDALGAGMLGEWELTPAAVSALSAAVEQVPTEASAMALLCAQGRRGEHPIRQGRRRVELTEAGGKAFFFDTAAALAGAAPLAAAVVDCDSLDEAQAVLSRLGIRTELDWEREAAA